MTKYFFWKKYLSG